MILGHNIAKHISKHSDNERRNCFFFSEDINLIFVLFLICSPNVCLLFR